MEVQYYNTKDGKSPVKEWFKRLKDKKAKAALFVRIDRLKLNLVGNAKSVRDGVFELRIDVGAGYRLYFAQVGKETVLLLCAGTKGSKKEQDADIVLAKTYLADFRKD